MLSIIIISDAGTERCMRMAMQSIREHVLINEIHECWLNTTQTLPLRTGETVIAPRQEHFENPRGQSLCLLPRKEVTRWPWMLWILVNILQNRCVTSKDSVADRVVVDVKCVHHDVKTEEEGSESNVDVYEGVVVDGVAPSGKAQTCGGSHARWISRPYGVCLWGCRRWRTILDIAEEVQ